MSGPLPADLSAVSISVGADVKVAGLSRDVEVDIAAANTFPNPDYARRTRIGLWTGGTPPTLSVWRRTPDGLVVPRGALALVVDVCRQHGQRCVVTDRTICPPVGFDLSTKGRLYPFQQRALDALLRQPTGFLWAPTGSGKTNILLSTIALLNTPTLILTHTKALLDQTAARCRAWLGVEPGIIGSGRWTVQPITIAMIQTLARRGCDGIANDFGAVLTDEGHHTPARTWAKVVGAFPARYRYAFTATPWRKDGLQDLLFRTVGPVTAHIDTSEVVAAGTILKPDVVTVETAFRYELRGSIDWTQMLTALVQDEARNHLLAAEVRRRLTPETRAIVLTGRVEHVARLAEVLADLDPVCLTEEVSKAFLAAGMARVRAGARITIATAALLGEGVDVPGWDLLFLASPMAGGPRTLQAVGRVCRASPGKTTATVVDFVDRHVPALMAAHRQRQRVLGIGRVA